MKALHIPIDAIITYNESLGEILVSVFNSEGTGGTCTTIPVTEVAKLGLTAHELRSMCMEHNKIVRKW